MQDSLKYNEYIVTARKWRPQKFSEVVGQEHITTTLKNAILSNRVHHAYLFSGPRGVGKTTTARIYSRAVNFPESIELSAEEMPQGCKDILDGRSMDVIEIDGASNNSVDDIRSLRENAKYPPSSLKYKIYIIDEVHMLSTSAFNALLKTLEEPPKHLLFVFATTEIHKVPATILSRCQRFDFKRMNTANIIKQLGMIAESEGIQLEEKALITIAKKADGSMRDAQSIFDQVVAFCGNDVKYIEMADALHLIDDDFYFQITDAIIAHNHSDMFELTNKLVSKGYDLKETLEGLLEHLRDLTAVKVTGKFELVETASSHIKKIEETISNFTKNDLIRMMSILNEAIKEIKFSSQPRIRFELALSQLASIESSTDITELLNEIKSLKKKSNIARVVKEPETQYKAEIKQNIPETKAKKSIDPNMLNWRKFLKSEAVKEFNAFIAQVLPQFHQDKITLTADTKFIYDMIIQVDTQLKNAISEIFGNHIKTEIKLDEKADIRNETFQEIQSFNKVESKGSSKKPDLKFKIEDLPEIEQTLINKFGAEKVN